MRCLRSSVSYLGVLVLCLVHFLPLKWIGAIGAAIGSILYRFGRGRVTEINLAMCFPEMPEAERLALGRRHFRMLGRNAVDLSVMVWGSEADLLEMIHVEGIQHLKSADGRPIIALAPHFICLNMCAIPVPTEYPATPCESVRHKTP